MGPNLEPHRHGLRERYLYVVWHENMLLPVCRYARPDVWVLISKHADGQLIAEVCRHLGIRVVRGSTTRGGIGATWQMLQLGKKSHLVITPDGPRGPRRRLQPGVVSLAALTGMPIVPVGIGFHRPWRTRSWDRMALPRPFSRGVYVTAQPILVPPEVSGKLLEEYTSLVEVELQRASEVAEQWAEGQAKEALHVPEVAAPREKDDGRALASVNGQS
jgi:lysophospholipid acyltransferase (LPLAT)-like uncharacterized protein